MTVTVKKVYPKDAMDYAREMAPIGLRLICVNGDYAPKGGYWWQERGWFWIGDLIANLEWRDDTLCVTVQASKVGEWESRIEEWAHRASLATQRPIMVILLQDGYPGRA